MNQPSHPDATNAETSSGDGGQAEVITDPSAGKGRGTGDQFYSTTGVYGDPSLNAILEALRPSADGEHSAVWSVLTDSARLRAIRDSGLLDEGPHPQAESIVGLTVEAMGIPFAALNVITDVEQVHAAITAHSGEVGTQRTHALPDSLCVYAVVTGSPLVIDDIVDHPVLREHSAALSGQVGAYIGIPITDADGHSVGTLCAWDTRPHHWSSGEIQIMNDLAEVVRDAIFE